ncbi:GbsR/MarR family transcriptional regulator [Paramicrobacterium sp. CJ85]|uniref:GbsR/MarR family transcriptional regulator n=1 Tax=Paramicrobacterium sp. CJ85 TaxID=3445355 RepID=UPI003F601807
MNGEQATFVNAMGDTLAAWNLSRATGRVYGYLLLQAEPSRSEDLRSELSLSSGAVSTATRELVAWGLARTIPQSGSRRLLVEAAGGFEQLLAASHERTRTFIRTLQDARELTESEDAAQRLSDVTELFSSYLDAGERVLRERSRS